MDNARSGGAGCTGRCNSGGVGNDLRGVLMDRFDVVMVISVLMLGLVLLLEWMGNT